MRRPADHRWMLCCALWASLVVLMPGAAAAQDTAAAETRDTTFVERGGQPQDLKLDGRFALRDVYSFDNQTNWDIHILFFDADLRGYDLAEVGGADLNFRLDSRWLYDLTQDNLISQDSDISPKRERNERRFGKTQTYADVRLLYGELEGLGDLDLALGRQWFYQAGGAWVDGAGAELHLTDTWSVATFGGLQPNPADYSIDAERQTAGAFAAYEANRLQFSGAYTLQLFQGELDRHYLFSRGHWAVPVESTKSLFLSYYASLDLQNEDPVLTTFFTNTSWWLNETLNFSIHYARFANTRLRHPDVQRVEPEENQRDLLGNVINQGSYDQIRAAAAQRFGFWYVYQQIDYRQRDLIDQRSATYYRVGLRNGDLWGTGTSLHTRFTLRNNFASDSSEYLVEAARRFGGVFELDGAIIYQTGRSLVADQSQDVILINARGIYDITPSLYFTLDYELTRETNIRQEEDETAGDLDVHTLFTRLTYRL